MSEQVLDKRQANFLVALDWAWLAFVRAEAASRRDHSRQAYQAFRRAEKELLRAMTRAARCPEPSHHSQPLMGCEFHREDAEQVVREQGEF